jgi:hypothetical protein
MFYMKNKNTIIKAYNDIFNLWAKLIVAHSNVELIDLNTKMKYNKNKRFDGSPRFQLYHKFFKQLGNITKMQFEKLAI